MTYLKRKLPIQRILHIVKRLYVSETLQNKTLASEYDVSSRTIHRDMQKISEIIPLLNNAGTWKLDIVQLPETHNHFYQALLGSFAHNVDIDIECLDKSNINKDNVAFALDYKNLPKNLGEKILHCIEIEEQCAFTYVKEKSSTQRHIDPIKIYTENGRWYVIARDYKDDKIKYFNLAKIKEFKHLKSHACTLTQEMLDEADKMQSIWSSTGEKEILVKLYIKPEVASYIKDIKLHKSQTIENEHHDGGLEVHCTITHKLELLPQVKYWLPRVHILEPLWLRDELLVDLEIYRDEDDRLR